MQMQRMVHTVRGDRIVIRQRNRDEAPDLYIEKPDGRPYGFPTQLTTEDVVEFIRKLAETLTPVEEFDLARTLRKDSVIRDMRERVRNVRE